MRLSVAACLILALGACSTTPPPPPPPIWGVGLPDDWPARITAPDHDRYRRLDAAWDRALDDTRRLPGSGDLRPLGDLIVPDAQRSGVTPPVGDYRCRTVKLGSQDPGGLGFVVNGWFACRIEQTPMGLKFVKVTGSQRPSGLLFPEDDGRMVMLGSMALGSEPAADSYGQTPDRDTVAVLQRIGEASWRLAVPWPHNESILDLIELVPAR